MDKFEEMLGRALDDMVDEEMEIRERERESYNQALEEFKQKLIGKIREDTCGCAYDARMIIEDTFNQMYK